MKTKLIVNSALSVLVALGVAACSSGGGSSSNNVKKTEVKPQTDQSAAKMADTKEKNAKTPTETPPVVAPQQPEQPKASAVHDNFPIATKNSGKVDLTAVDTLLKEKVSLSETGGLVLVVDRKPMPAAETIFITSGTGINAKLIEFVNNESHQWKYQTFGKFDVIENDLSGFASVGNKTDISAIPTEGVISYKGVVRATSAIPSNREMSGTVKADVAVDVDFATKEVKFKTENSKLFNSRTGKEGKDTSSFNLMGTAKLDGAKNQFVEGKVHFTDTPNKVGQLDGALYGPKAEEIGGAFNIENGTLLGGFGAKQESNDK